MKAVPQTVPFRASTVRWHATLLCDLFKARLTTLVLVTTAVGFYLGSRNQWSLPRFLLTLAGTGLLACGASALNQWLERDLDALMARTHDRPLPSGRLGPDTAWWLGMATSVAGVLVLGLWIGWLAALLGAITWLIYVWIYTPLKRITTLNTVVGAVPGALPPVIGWSAARGTLEPEGWALFALMVFWQLPHFLAIAWLYRDDYARAGFAMLPVGDPSGERTAGQALAHTLGLLAVSLAPVTLGLAGGIYLAGAAVLGVLFLWRALRFSKLRTQGQARSLFYASILYLPLLLGLLVLDKN